jgi:diphosphomevalonate decarboxylase
VAVKIELQSLQYWIDNLSILVCVVKPEGDQDRVKEVPSTEGMALSLKTSELM